MKTKVLMIIGVTAICSACSWVKLTPAGKGVDVRVSTSVANCKPMGDLTVSGVDNVSIYKRNLEKVESELTTQARNDAAVMGANVIVPVAKPLEGRQKFKTYQCP
ncbi:DUF4156 domain-containing protein [Marinibactrum halimedae]|uniref:DUF4156 domain-containing protein n=1 Tax=Marinibactrum halimedae TaxID=1444977 RepID=A0AA37WL46_9GAMM|nr:DUF4156 domain-containing protein [Marinibactrum halimedae]MCD9457706.1 DUF4156 domain-containing protein [Marinibactrum halimedae]GLS24920.1 hypothetical protein GCM10007877_06340 [Marinibactrum halimedae]